MVNNCQSDIYGLHYEYYIDGQPIGGAIVRVANTAIIPLSSGNATVLTFTPADFPADADFKANARFTVQSILTWARCLV